jgi:hypothetical protein
MQFLFILLVRLPNPHIQDKTDFFALEHEGVKTSNFYVFDQVVFLLLLVFLIMYRRKIAR